MVGEDTASPVMLTNAQVDRLINDAVREIARMTGCLEKRYLAEVTSGTAQYTLPADMYEPFRVAWDEKRLEGTSAAYLDHMDGGWRSRSGDPVAFLVDHETQSPLTVRLYKEPSADGAKATGSSEYGVTSRMVDSSGAFTYTFTADTTANADHTDADLGVICQVSESDGDPSYVMDAEYGVMTDMTFYDGNLEVWSKKAPATLSADTDVPDIPAHTHIAVAFLAASRALEFDDEVENPELGDIYRAIADDYTKYLKRLVGNRTPERTHWIGDRKTRRPRIGIGEVQMPSNYPGY